MFDQQKLEKKIQIYFKNPELLKLAFVHKSYVNEFTDRKLDSNERLEFLGDAVLELIVTDFLYSKYPNSPEGELTALRSALVKGEHLSDVANKLELGEHLFLSKGESNSGGRSKSYILADTVEALIGAIYLDLGYDKAKEFIQKYILPDIEQIISKGTYQDAKSFFQEKSQELENFTPEYKLHSETGPDHKKVFEMGAYIKDKLIATGQGSSKQKAEQDAATKAIKALDW